MTRRRELLSLVVFSWLSAAATHAQAYEFLPLGDLRSGGYFTEVTDISGNGSIVVGNSRSLDHDEDGYFYDYEDSVPFRWTRNGGFESLVDARDQWAAATAISDDGSTIVGVSGPTQSTADGFRWTESEGRVSLAGGEFDPRPLGVSADGAVIVGAGYETAYRWTQESGWIDISAPESYSTLAAPVAVSVDGSVVAGTIIPEHGYDYSAVWRTSAEGWRASYLDESPEFYSRAVAMSADGATIVGFKDAGYTNEVLLFTEDGVEHLGNFFGEPRPGYDEYTAVYDASADASAIVGQAWRGSAGFAVIWTRDGGWRRVDDLLTEQGIDLGGWELSHATAISADGTTIVGQGYDAQGRKWAWLAVIVPEPAACVLMVIGAALALTHRKLRADRHCRLAQAES